MEHQELLAGLIRLHILHHAAEGEIYGLWIIEELARHGYRLSPGTVYPLLHGMEEKGYLTSRQTRVNSKQRRVYSATPLGHTALDAVKDKVRELFEELLEEPASKRRSARDSRSQQPEQE
jgi:DNA-binding PadR family transcriptional regulator